MRILAVLALLVLVACIPQTAKEQQGLEQTPGTVVFAIAGTEKPISGLQSMNITLESIIVRGANETRVLINKTVDLFVLEKKGFSFLETTRLWNGTYTNLTLVFESASVNGTNAFLPARTMDMSVRVDVFSGETATLVFDVLAKKSMHQTIDGQYVFAPAIRVVSRKKVGRVSVYDNVVRVYRGEQSDAREYGMLASGNIVEGKQIDQQEKLQLINGTLVNTGGSS